MQLKQFQALDQEVRPCMPTRQYMNFDWSDLPLDLSAANLGYYILNYFY